MEIEGCLLVVGLCLVSAVTQKPNKNPIAWTLQDSFFSVLQARRGITIYCGHPSDTEWTPAQNLFQISRLANTQSVKVLLLTW